MVALKIKIFNLFCEFVRLLLWDLFLLQFSAKLLTFYWLIFWVLSFLINYLNSVSRVFFKKP